MAEEAPRPLRLGFAAELEQLRLQVEVMAVRVSEALGRMSLVLRTGDTEAAAAALAADDQIDAMHVSLTERCYDLLRRETPVASDLRFVVSVLRMLEELERVGDLALRVVKLAPQHELLASRPETFDTLVAMAHEATRLFDLAVAAWSAQDVDGAAALVTGDRRVASLDATLMGDILRVDGPDAVPLAVTTLLAGRALERIADHTVIIGERLRYMLTGDPAYLATEVR